MKPLLAVKSVTERIAWHSFPLGDVFVHLNSKRDGLTTAEAKLRQKHFGLNVLSPPPVLPVWKILLGHFSNPLDLGLIGAAALAIFLGSRWDGGVILALILFNGLIGFIKKRKSEKSWQGLRRLETNFAVALRDGAAKKIPASEIVPGDVVILKSGGRIPADARIIKTCGLKVDEIIFTGQSKEAVKSMETVAATASIFERSNIVFSGTMASDGAAEAVVFGTGDNSEMGRIAKPPNGFVQPQTIFEKRLLKLSRFIGAAVLILSGLIFIWGLAAGRDFNEILLVAAALAASAASQGWPMIIVAGLNKIKNKGLVISTAAAKALGAVSIILTHKTGVLTRGEMQVTKALIPERRGGIFQMNATVEYADNRMLMLSYGMLASDAVVENTEDEVSDLIIQTSPVGRALFRAGIQAGLDLSQLNKKFRKVGEISFSGSRKYSASFRENPEGELWAIAAGDPDK